MSKRHIDRRAVFFFISAVLSFALIPLTPEDFMWVGKVLGSALIVLGCLSWLDHYSRRHSGT